MPDHFENTHNHKKALTIIEHSSVGPFGSFYALRTDALRTAALRNRSRKLHPMKKLAHVALSAVDRYQDRESAVVRLLVSGKPLVGHFSAVDPGVSGRPIVGQRSPACWSLFSGRPLSRPKFSGRPLRQVLNKSKSLIQHYKKSWPTSVAP